MPTVAAVRESAGRVAPRGQHLFQSVLPDTLDSTRLTNIPEAAYASDTAHSHASHAAGMLYQILEATVYCYQSILARPWMKCTL